MKYAVVYSYYYRISDSIRHLGIRSSRWPRETRRVAEGRWSGARRSLVADDGGCRLRHSPRRRLLSPTLFDELFEPGLSLKGLEPPCVRRRQARRGWPRRCGAGDSVGRSHRPPNQKSTSRRIAMHGIRAAQSGAGCQIEPHEQRPADQLPQPEGRPITAGPWFKEPTPAPVAASSMGRPSTHGSRPQHPRTAPADTIPSIRNRWQDFPPEGQNSRQPEVWFRYHSMWFPRSPIADQLRTYFPSTNRRPR